LFLFTACESDEKKLMRLQGDALRAQLLTQNKAEHCADVKKAEPGFIPPRVGPKYRACMYTLIELRAKSDLAERELNRFMR